MSETAKTGGSGTGLANARKDALVKASLVPSAEGLAIMKPPSTLEEQCDYAHKLTAWLLGLLSQDCSPSERVAWVSKSPPEILKHVHSKLDEIIIRNADVYTWRMWYCPL